MGHNGNGASRLGVYASIFMAISVILGAFVWVGNLSSSLAQSQSDIRSLQSRVTDTESELRALSILNASSDKNNCQQFAKTETQMGLVEAVINKINVDFQRDMGALDFKVFGLAKPSIYDHIAIPHEIMPC